MKPELDLRLRAVSKLLEKPHLDPEGRRYLVGVYLDVCRQGRRLNIRQWETARGLADGWHGTLEDLVTAAKELA